MTTTIRIQMRNNSDARALLMYRVRWTNGRSDDTAETYEAAKALVLAEYPDAEIGHDGDLEGYGDRTLCWASEEDSVDDDGARAVCSIRVAS